jgi:hypothetical protein
MDKMIKREADERLRSALERELNQSLVNNSFTISRGLGKYSRAKGSAKQRIWIMLRMPTYSDDLNIAHVTGAVSIIMPNVNSVAWELSGHNEDLLGGREYTLSHQLGIVGPDNTLREWHVREPNDFDSAVRELAGYISLYVVPYLDRYTDAESLVDGFRDHDKRLRFDRPLFLYVAAALLVLDKPQEAYNVVNNAFGSTPGLAREYAFPLNYLRERAALKV